MDDARTTQDESERRAGSIIEIARAFHQRTDNLPELLEHVVSILAGWPGEGASIELADDDGWLHTATFFHPDRQVQELFAQARSKTDTRLGGPDPEADPTRAGEQVLYDLTMVFGIDELAHIHENYQPFLKESGMTAGVVVPLHAASGVIGTIGLLRTGPAYTPAEVAFVEGVADHAALAIENASLINRLQILHGERLRLLGQLVEAQEQERRRLAEDLHDDPIQSLTAVQLRLATMAKQRDPAAARDQLAEITTLLQDTIGRLRTLMFDLRPPSLDEVGLGAAIHQTMGHLFDDGPTAWSFTDAPDVRLDEEVDWFAFRIVLEALTNVRRHADASKVSVTLDEEHDGLAIRITDDGAGFAPGSGSAVAPGHLGLIAMRERAELAGGSLTITSRVGSGTTIRCWLPASERIRGG